MAIGLLGRKVGMTQVFDEKGTAVPVTVIQAGPCPVVQKKTAETDGYEALQLGFEAQPKLNRLTKPVRGHFDKAQVPYQRRLQEIRLRGGEGEFAVGQVLTVALFAAGDRVRVTGVTKGRGFQGGVKRWNYKGGPMTHGAMFHRAPGSIGASSYPSRVFRGHHLPGHMGAVRATVQGLRVVAVDTENNLLLIEGAVPGPSGGMVTVQKGK
ncbi:MAG TPA: 50S ribosomal protein L3 [Candidatus Baltobacteraceae bacterium]|nr:50S ribosomal protein L3 [Candidatus Baltobacteraceae bacterium]